MFQPRLSIGQFDQTFKFPKNFTVSIIRFKEIFLTQFNCYLAAFNSDPYQIFNSNQILQLRTVYVSRETIVTNVFVEHTPNLLIVVGLFPIKIYFKRIRRKITGNVSLISINELGNVDRRARNRERNSSLRSRGVSTGRKQNEISWFRDDVSKRRKWTSRKKLEYHD